MAPFQYGKTLGSLCRCLYAPVREVITKILNSVIVQIEGVGEDKTHSKHFDVAFKKTIIWELCEHKGGGGTFRLILHLLSKGNRLFVRQKAQFKERVNHVVTLYLSGWLDDANTM